MTTIQDLTKEQFNLTRNYLRNSIAENRNSYKETACLQIYNELLGKENSHELTKSHHDKWHFNRVKQGVLKEIAELLEKAEGEEIQNV
jgi:hypothetical protein